MYSVKRLAGMMTIKVLESVSKIFLAKMGVPIQMFQLVEVMRIDFNELHMH